jgi:hypothetical protein
MLESPTGKAHVGSRNAKDYSAGDNSCPYTYDYVARDQKRVSTCGFIRFIAIFSTIVAWLMVHLPMNMSQSYLILVLT